MKVLFIGGTGVITTDTARLAVRRGMDVTLLNRGSSRLAPEGARQLHADIFDRAQADATLGNETFDVILDCISYTPEQLRYKLELLRGRFRQFIFISSVAAYVPGVPLPIREDATPLGNFGWDYGRDKAAGEYEMWREHRIYGGEFTAVRPGETYNDLRVPGVIVANPFHGGYTILNRIRTGKPVLVHDDGHTISPFTHATDIAKGIVGLFLNEKAYGQAFHITTDETHSWREVTEMVGDAAGARPHIVYAPSLDLARVMPHTPHGDTYGVISCAKAFDAAFDNSKIRAAVPDFECTVTLEEGLRRTVAFYDENPEYKQIDTALDAELDRVAALFSK